MYNEKLDPTEQIDAEEHIAALLHDTYGISEHEAQEAGRDILMDVLLRFRPDLIGPTRPPVCKTHPSSSFDKDLGCRACVLGWPPENGS